MATVRGWYWCVSVCPYACPYACLRVCLGAWVCCHTALTGVTWHTTDNGIKTSELPLFLSTLKTAYNLTSPHADKVLSGLGVLIPDQQRGVWQTYQTLFTKTKGTFAMVQ